LGSKSKPGGSIHSFGVCPGGGSEIPSTSAAASFFLPQASGEGALSFLSRGIREDLRLIRARAGELETFLNAPVPESELFARLRRATASSGQTRLDLSAIGKAFEVESWKAPRAARWRWEGEAEEWEPVRKVKARLKELERTRQGQSASYMIQKVKLGLVSSLNLGYCNC
jgi:digalactosyldiacylglycerol synthase